MGNLVVYYSRTATTARVANALAEKVGADIVQIQCARYRSGWFRYLLAGYDSVKGRLPPIEFPEISVQDCDLLLIGAPIWTSYPALPLRSFLAQIERVPKRVGLFLTYGGHSPPEKAVDIVSDLLQTPLCGSLTLEQNDVVNGRFSSRIDEFVEALACPE